MGRPYSADTYAQLSDQVMELLASYPQGITIKSTAHHLKWTPHRAKALLRQMAADGILATKYLPNPSGKGGQKLVSYTLAPAGARQRLGDPVTPAPKVQTVAVKEYAKPTDTWPREKQALIDTGRELLSRSIAGALLGEGYDVELALLKIAVFHLRTSK